MDEEQRGFKLTNEMEQASSDVEDQRENTTKEKENQLRSDHSARFQSPRSSQDLVFSQTQHGETYSNREIVQHEKSPKSRKGTRQLSATSESETNVVAKLEYTDVLPETCQEMKARVANGGTTELLFIRNSSNAIGGHEMRIAVPPTLLVGGRPAVDFPSQSILAEDEASAASGTLESCDEIVKENFNNGVNKTSSANVVESGVDQSPHRAIAPGSAPSISKHFAPPDMTDGKSDRTISTDDDEYSGCDIDIGALSGLEEIFIVEEETMTDYNSFDNPTIRRACDSGNIPVFVNVKHLVDNQVQSLQTDKPYGYYNKMTTDKTPWRDYSAALPPDSNGILEEHYSSYKDDDENPSPNINLEDLNAETSARVAAETVANAIAEACRIVCGDLKENVVYSGTGTVTHFVNDITSLLGDKRPNLVSKSTGVHELFMGFSSEIQGESAAEISRYHLVEKPEHVVPYGGDKVLTEFSAVAHGTAATAEMDSDTRDYKQQSTVIEREVTVASEDYRQNSPGKEEDIVGRNKIPLTKSCERIAALTDKSTVKSEEYMGNATESTDKPCRNFAGNIVLAYNPALSQRNTEATKWFGQPTSENKIWMKPLGKVDESAEMERRKVIKAMTRRHNPNIAPKWQPSLEKDYTEDLDEKKTESLKKYEERRRNRIDASIRVDTLTTARDALTVEETPTEEPSVSLKLPRENIVIESVVRSADAISAWEYRLNDKLMKEELERKRLSAGKQKKGSEHAWPGISKTRTYSAPSVYAKTSTILPTSEHIERESMDVSEVRNRWKNIEEQSNKARPVRSERKGSSRNSNSFLSAPPRHRSHQSPPALPYTTNGAPVSSPSRGPIVRSSLNKESFIDREIREAAEREEKWKHEQREKMSEVSVASSEEALPSVEATVYTGHLLTPASVGFDIPKDAVLGENRISEYDPIYDSSDAGGSDLVSSFHAPQDKTREPMTKQQDGYDLGRSTPIPEYAESDLDETYVLHYTDKKEVPEVKSSKLQHISELQGGRSQSVCINAPGSTALGSDARETSPRDNMKHKFSSDEKHATSLKCKQGVNKSDSLLQKKSSRVEVSSSKSRLQAAMQKEMFDVSVREEEWRKQQLELIDQGIGITSHHALHSTREIRTPNATAPLSPFNAIQSEVSPRRSVKSVFTYNNDDRPSRMKDERYDFGKRAVVKAVRVPKRKSQLAMMWEDRAFENNIPNKNE